MIKITQPKDIARLRRLALASQGLLCVEPFGRGLAGARKTVQHIGYVQIDTISVVERAHHHVLYARVPNFKPTMCQQLLLDRDVFEYWSHAAAFLPMDDFRFSLSYKHAIKSGQTHWYKKRDTQLMSELLARVRSDGPIRSRDLEEGGVKERVKEGVKREGWWDWKPAKKALEQLYMEGDLMVSDREGFQKSYDLTERVLPSGVNIQMPTIEEFAGHLLDQQLRCNGVVSLKGLTYLRKNAALRKAVKILIDEQLSQGILEPVQLISGEIFFIPAGCFEQPMSRLSNRLHILSPFDNSVIQRERLKVLFGYDYQIECYVPAAKRQYGYFCLPLLFRGEFIGRMDCKAHRKEKRLEIKALYLEAHTGGGYSADEEELVVSAFAEAVAKFSRFQQCESVTLSRVEPSHLAQPLQQALKACYDS